MSKRCSPPTWTRCTSACPRSRTGRSRTCCSRRACRGFTAVNIRKFVLKAARLSDLVELGSLTPAAAAFLEASVRAGLNVLVAGGTQAGKTTLLNCLAAAIPGGDRVVSAEEVFELRFPHPDWVPMQTRQSGLEGTGEIALRDLVRESLRMRPSRIIVGEVRSEECLDLLLALNAGLPGMCTLRANSAREALVKMCTLPLLAGDEVGESDGPIANVAAPMSGAPMSGAPISGAPMSGAPISGLGMIEIMRLCE